MKPLIFWFPFHMEKHSGFLQGLLAHVLGASGAHPTFLYTWLFARDAAWQPAPPCLQTPKLGKSVKVIQNSPFMLKGMALLSIPDFPVSLQRIYFSTRCAHWPDSKSLTPIERKWVAVPGTSCRLLWVHRPGFPVSIRTAGKQLQSPFVSRIPPFPSQDLGSYQVVLVLAPLWEAAY